MNCPNTKELPGICDGVPMFCRGCCESANRLSQLMSESRDEARAEVKALNLQVDDLKKAATHNEEYFKRKLKEAEDKADQLNGEMRNLLSDIHEAGRGLFLQLDPRSGVGERLSIVWDRLAPYAVKRNHITVNGNPCAVGNTLTYEEILKLARQREGATVVCKPMDRRLSGFTVIKGQTVEVSDGMAIVCMMTGNA